MHIYIHIPFCRTFCTYCNFYSVKNLHNRDLYLKAVLNEAQLNKDFFKNDNEECHTLYLGGGTPSCLKPEQLTGLIAGIRHIFPVTFKEITVEANPNDITPEFVKALAEAGVNRVSMGVQSFIDEHLKWMNRRHTSAEVYSAVNMLRSAGISNISLDLIFGYEMLAEKDWAYNLDRITELRPTHISAYQMSIENGSALWNLYNKGLYNVPPDEVCAKEYTMLQEHLYKAGYIQYEISNFSLGHENKSLHNSSYWERVPYLGLGPFAHSYCGNVRSWNVPVLKRYLNYYLYPDKFSKVEDSRLERVEALKEAGVAYFEELSSLDIFNEFIMLGLRTRKGINLRDLKERFPYYFFQIEKDIEQMLRKGELELVHCSNGSNCGQHVRISKEFLFVADSIIRTLFAI